MSAVDFEAAWYDLAARIAERPGWGSRQLAAEMAEVAAANRVSETFLARALRLYGGRLTLAVDQADEGSSGGGGEPPVPAALDAPYDDHRGGHDGRRERDGALAG